MGELIKNEVMDTILSRRSIRSYLDKQITDAELNTILEAGVWAPTARNQQEVDFYVIRDRKKIESISQKFSKYTKREKVQDISFGAPTLILLYAKTGSRFMDVDVGISAENLSLAAQSLGIGSLIIGCFKEYMLSEAGADFEKSLGIPEGFTFGIAVALGYTANPTKPQARRENKVKYL